MEETTHETKHTKEAGTIPGVTQAEEGAVEGRECFYGVTVGGFLGVVRSMSFLLPHWRRWWARLRGQSAKAPAVEPEPIAPVENCAPEKTAEPEKEVEPLAHSVRPAEDMTSLLETVGAKSLAQVAVVAKESDAAVRERMLEELRNLRQIPALQSLVQGFQRAMSRTDVSVDEVLEAISRDAALCVRVLRMANSVTVASEQRVEDLPTAVQLLGVVRVRKAAQALFTLRDASRTNEGFDWRHLWIHALATAAIAEELEQRLRPADDTQIHLAALLHDLGKIVLSTVAPEAYREVLVLAWNDGGRLEKLERERLGVDHREAGVVFARQNALPEIVVQAIAHHDRPEEAESFQLEVAMIALANYLSKAHGLGFSGSRLTAEDGEFAEQPAWKVVAAACGPVDPEAIEAEMGKFMNEVRADLRGLRESV